MKRILTAILALLPTLTLAAGGDLFINQRNTDNTATLTRSVTKPAGTADGVFGFNGVTQLPVFLTMGPGLTLSGGVLDAAPASVSWANVTGKPAFAAVATSGAYADLTGLPVTFSPSTHTHAAADVTSGTFPLARLPALPISQTTGLQTALDSKFATPAGTASQYVNGTGALTTFPTTFAPAAHTQAWSTITATPTTLAGYGITDALPRPTGTTAQYIRGDGSLATLPSSAPTINDAPARALVTTTAATGYQVSATRIAHVCYEGTFATTSTIGGPSSASVFLETADTNSTTPADWTTRAQQTYSNTITLAVVLNQVQSNNWSFCRYIPAGKYVRLRSGNISGTASVSLNAAQQETLY